MNQTAAEKSGSNSGNLYKEENKFYWRQFAGKEKFRINEPDVTGFIDEFWTSKQRQNNPLHEISYRACFKAELPRFFIKSLTNDGDIVYDPFAGRGTTIIEAALLNRNVVANDINPLSIILTKPRLFVPTVNEVESRLNQIKFSENERAEIDLSMFYHPKTESEIVSLKNYLISGKNSDKEDYVDQWIRMTATNRLTGHSKNFFSVYTLPPNQAASQERQKKINNSRNQFPIYKNVKEIILKKTRDLLKKLSAEEIRQLKRIGERAEFFTEDAGQTEKIKSGSVSLTVTSPPFLDVVNYREDNWLRCWFNNINAYEIAGRMTVTNKLDGWLNKMKKVFEELNRVTKNYGWVAFEVGEVKRGRIKLDEHIVPIGIDAGFSCEGILINQQKFTKTSNIWGILNNKSGTNTNRIVLFQKRK